MRTTLPPNYHFWRSTEKRRTHETR